MALTYKQEQELARFTETKLLHLALIEMVNGIIAEQPRIADQGQDVPLCDCSEPGKCSYTKPTQPRAAEQGQSICTCGYDARNNERDLDVNCSVHMPMQPSAGDVVQAMVLAYDEAISGNDNIYRGMAAALAVAREGYVSIDDALGPICEERTKEIWESRKTLRDGNLCDYGAIAPVINAELTYRRNRLAKPAEQTDEQRVAAMLSSFSNSSATPDYPAQAKQIIAALRDERGGQK